MAVVFGSERLTYGELDGRVGGWRAICGTPGRLAPGGTTWASAWSLRRPGWSRVAVLEAGGAYVPLDPSYPRERLDFLVRDSGAAVLVTEERWLAALPIPPRNGPAVVCLDRDEAWEGLAVEPSAAVPIPASALAYVMYTSGSTGEPKGVAVSHRGVVRLVREAGYARFGPDEVMLQIAPYTFDASTPEIWGALLNGGCLVIPPPGLLSLAELGELRRYGVTTLHLTTGGFTTRWWRRTSRLSRGCASS